MSSLFFDDELEEKGETAVCDNVSMEPPCLGHETVEDQLLKLYNARQLPHALVFSGIKGIGKAMFAERFVRFLLKEGERSSADMGLFGGDAASPMLATSFSVPSNDPVAAKVTARGHPDFMLVERQFDENKGRYKGNVDVNSVRKIVPFMRMTPSVENGWRIAIIDDADMMNRNAQNAILKILEEPPEKALLILVTHRIGALIPTIRSRSRLVNFGPLSAEVLKRVIQRNESFENLPEEDTDMLSGMAEGSAGKAFSYAEENALDILNQLADLLDNWPDIRMTELHSFADQMATPAKDRALSVFQEILLWSFQSLVKHKARGILPSHPPLNKPVFKAFAAHCSLENLIEICDGLKTHFDLSEKGYLDRRYIVMEAFNIMKNVA